MVYTINLSNYTAIYKVLATKNFKPNAIRKLIAFKFGTTEKLLDNYLQNQYQMSLKQACYTIITNCTIEESEETLLITISNKTLDKIARIITYGTGKLLGSQILLKVLNKL